MHQTTFTIRTCDVTSDSAAMVALFNLAQTEPIQAPDLDEALGDGNRSVARDEHGQLLGFAASAQQPGMPAGKLKLTLTVAPEARGRGVGGALLTDLERQDRAQGARAYYGEIWDHDVQTLAFCQHRGFTIIRQIHQQRLELATFDDAAWLPVVKAVEATGIRFFYLYDELTDANVAKAYAVAKESQEEIPGNEERQPPLRLWRKIVIDSGVIPHHGIIVADDTTRPDADHFAGIAFLGPMPQPGAVYNTFTGTAHDYRRRNIGLALKILSVQAARAMGGTYLLTDNNADNAPILGVNRKLGFVRTGGHYLLNKLLQGGVSS